MYDKTRKTWSQRLKIHKSEKSNPATSTATTTTTTTTTAISTGKNPTTPTRTTAKTTATTTSVTCKKFNSNNEQQYHRHHQNQKQAPTLTYFDHNNVSMVTATTQQKQWQQQQQQQQQQRPQTSFHRQTITPNTTKTHLNAVMHLPIGLQMGYDYNTTAAAAVVANNSNGGGNVTTSTAARINRDYNFGTYTRTYTEPWIYSTVRGIPGHHYASTYYYGCYQNPFITTSAATSAITPPPAPPPPLPYSPQQQQYNSNHYHSHSHPLHQQALTTAIFATPTRASAATPTAMAVVICSCIEYLRGTKKYRDMKKPIICKKCKGTRLPLANIGSPNIGMGMGMGVGLEGGLNILPLSNKTNTKLLRPIGTAATVRCVSTTKKLRPTILDPQRDPYDLMRRTRLLSPEPAVPIINHSKLFVKDHMSKPVSTSMRERSRSRIPKPKMLMTMMLNGNSNDDTNNDNNNENNLKQQIDNNWLNDMEKNSDIKSLASSPSTSPTLTASSPSPTAGISLLSESTAETRPINHLRRSILGCNVNPYELISTTKILSDDDYDPNGHNSANKLSQNPLKTCDIEKKQLDKCKFIKKKLQHESKLPLRDKEYKFSDNETLSRLSSTSLAPSPNTNISNKVDQMKQQMEKINIKNMQNQKLKSKNKTLKIENEYEKEEYQENEEKTNLIKFENQESKICVKTNQAVEKAIVSKENHQNFIGNNNRCKEIDKEKYSENSSDSSSENSSEISSFEEKNITEFITVTVTPTYNIKSILKRPLTTTISAATITTATTSTLQTLNDHGEKKINSTAMMTTRITTMPDYYENTNGNNVHELRTYENNLQNNTIATKVATSTTKTNMIKHSPSDVLNNLPQQQQTTRKKVQFMMENKVITLNANQLKQQLIQEEENEHEEEQQKQYYSLASENYYDGDNVDDGDDFDDCDYDNENGKNQESPRNFNDNDVKMTINYEYYNKKRNVNMQQALKDDSVSSTSSEYFFPNDYELHVNDNNNNRNNNFNDNVNDNYNENEECIIPYDKQFIQAMLLKKLQLDTKDVNKQNNNHHPYEGNQNEDSFNSNLSQLNNKISHNKVNDNYENFLCDNVLSSTLITTTTYNSNNITVDNTHEIKMVKNVLQEEKEKLSKIVLNVEQKMTNNNHNEESDNNDNHNDSRTILQITKPKTADNSNKEENKDSKCDIKRTNYCLSMECLPSLDIEKKHITNLKRSTSDRRDRQFKQQQQQLQRHNECNNRNITTKEEQKEHSQDLKKFRITIGKSSMITETKDNGIKEEFKEKEQQEYVQHQKGKEKEDEKQGEKAVETIKESIKNLSSIGPSIKIATKIFTTEPKILTTYINNTNDNNYNQNCSEYETEHQIRNVKQNVYTTKVQSSTATHASSFSSSLSSSSAFSSSKVFSTSLSSPNKAQRTVVRVAPFNQKPTEVHRLKINHIDENLQYNLNHALQSNNYNNNNSPNHFTMNNFTPKSPVNYSYLSCGPSVSDFEQKKTSILINGDDDCYSTTNLGCDDTCTPLYQSSVVVNDNDVRRKGIADLSIISQNSNSVMINVNGHNSQEQQQSQKHMVGTSLTSNMSIKSVIPIGEPIKQVNLQRSASTTSSASSASSIISLSSLSGSGHGSGSGSNGDSGNSNGIGNDEHLKRSNRTLIRLESSLTLDQNTSPKRDDAKTKEQCPPSLSLSPTPSPSPSSTKLWLTHEEELYKILRNPIEAVKLNLVPHVCGRQNNDNDTNNNNKTKANNEKNITNISSTSITSTTSIPACSPIATTATRTMKLKGEHESFISKLLEDPMLSQVADGLETDTIFELIENSLRRLQEAQDYNNMHHSSKVTSSCMSTTTTNNIGNINRLINISLKLIQEEKAALNYPNNHNQQRINNKIINDNHNNQILSNALTTVSAHNINTCKDDENLSNRGSISSTNSFASAHNYEIFDYNENNESDCYQSCSSEIVSFIDDEFGTNQEARSKFYKMLVDATLAEIESTTNLKEDEEENVINKTRMRKAPIEIVDDDDDENNESDMNDENADVNDEHNDKHNENNLNVHNEHDYESICFSGDPIYEEISEIPPPLPKTAPPLNNVDADKKMARSIFEGASKYDILSYLVDAKERGIVKEESLCDNSILSGGGGGGSGSGYGGGGGGIPLNPQIIIEEESLDTLSDLDKRLQKTKYGRKEYMKNFENNNKQMDNTEDTTSPSQSLIILRNNKHTTTSNDIERNDSGVGSETSKSSRSKYQSKQQPQEQHQNQHQDVTTGKQLCSSPLLHLCEDCDGHVETQLTNDGILFASLVCRKCGKKRMERKEIITEIVETEEKYGRDLQIILEEFYQPMLVAGLLTQEQLSAIFLNTEELLENSQTLAERMRDALDIALEQGDDDLLTVNIGKIFLISTQMLHAFESYCVRQAAASLLLANLEKEKELLRIFLKVSQMENTVLRRMNLNSFLMVPVQRVTKYPLLLSRLHKVTPQHLDGCDQLREAQEKIELHLNHINQEAKDVPMKLWRRISSSSPNRRVSYEIDMINIKLRKMAIDLLEWNHDEVRFVMEGKLLFTQPTDNNWKRARTLKLVQINALLVTNGKPNVNYKVEKIPSDGINFPKHTGIREASLLIIKEKCGRYTFIHEPLFLDKCLICSEGDWDEYFEVQEISSKDTFIFKAEDNDRTKQWYTTLQYHAQGMGSWRKRRNALANIMINGMLTRT